MNHAPRSFLVLGALVAALGCQAPLPVAPAQPRVVVRTDALHVDPLAPLSLALERPCGDEPSGFALSQADAPLDPRIHHFDVRISGPSLVDDLVIGVPRSAFGTGCRWLSQFYELPPGSYLVAINAVDTHGGIIATAEGHQFVDPSTPVTVKVRCDFSSGELRLCIGTCPSGPTDPPSPNPTTPPSRPPSPIGGMFDRIHGLHADDEGNVYLFGLRPKPWTDPNRIGRIVEVAPGGAVRLVGPTKFPTSDFVMYEGEMSIVPFKGLDAMQALAGAPPHPGPTGKDPQSANATFTRFEDGRQVVGYSRKVPGDFLRPWGASVGLVGQIIAVGSSDPTQAAGYLIADISGVKYVDRRGLPGNRAAATERPLSMVIDNLKFGVKKPIWTCKRGILTSGVNFLAPPVELVSRPAYGLTKIVPFTNEVLFTTYEDGESRVFYVDLGGNRVTRTAFTFDAGIPHRIEKGADGAFYILLTEGPLPSNAASGNDPYMYEFPGSNAVRVVKMRYDATAKKLIDPQLVVDTFRNPTPSW